MTFDIGASQMGEGGGQKAQICALSFMQRERHETLILKGLQPGLVHKNNILGCVGTKSMQKQHQHMKSLIYTNKFNQ